MTQTRLSSAMKLFCKCISVRGMQKLCAGPKFLRGLWLIFVFSMTFLLLVSTTLIVFEFLKYDISVHTRLLLDDPSPFPALTVCHQPPFSIEAYQAWNMSKILSPTLYNRYIRQLTLTALRSNDLDTAESIWAYDNMSVYYQNLPYEHAIRVGHQTSIFLNCMKSTVSSIQIEHDCTQMVDFSVKRISHPLHMNCYTFEPTTQLTANETTIFSLVVSMGPTNRDVPTQQAFLGDMFEQARGLRVVVHEPGTRPNVAANGIHVEPGKLNEIVYETERIKTLNTPTKPCFHISETEKIRDLEHLYNYEHTHCLLRYQQEEIMKHCQCIHVHNPRLRFPNKHLPYCGNLWPEYNETVLLKRRQCVGRYLSPEVKRSFDGNRCLPRCEFYRFHSKTSIAQWRGKSWQLYWLRVQNEAQQSLIEYLTQWPDTNVTDLDAFKRWELYLTNKNITHIPTDEELIELANGTKIFEKMPKWPPKGLKLDGEDVVYVVLKRKSNNTVETNEQLVISWAVVVSRVGGLCSVTMGLTAACVVELIEFFYLLYFQSRKKDEPNHSNGGNENVALELIKNTHTG